MLSVHQALLAEISPIDMGQEGPSLPPRLFNNKLCNQILHQDMNATIEEPKATTASNAKVSKTLQPNLTACVFAMLYRPQAATHFSNI